MLSRMTTFRECAVLTVGVFVLPSIFGLPGVRWVETVPGAVLIAFVREGSESGIYTVEWSGSGLTGLTDGLPLTTTTRGPSAVSRRSERRVSAIDAIAVDVSSAHRDPPAEMADP